MGPVGIDGFHEINPFSRASRIRVWDGVSLSFAWMKRFSCWRSEMGTKITSVSSMTSTGRERTAVRYMGRTYSGRLRARTSRASRVRPSWGIGSIGVSIMFPHFGRDQSAHLLFLGSGRIQPKRSRPKRSRVGLRRGRGKLDCGLGPSGPRREELRERASFRAWLDGGSRWRR